MATAQTSLIIQISDAEHNPKTGTRASDLARLVRANLPVPRGFVVSADACRYALWALGDRASQSADADEQPARRLLDAELPEDLWQPIVQAYERLALQIGIANPPVTLQPSLESGGWTAAGMEDRAQVRGLDALRKSICSIWSATCSSSAVRRAGAQPVTAVIVQQAIPAQAAGVVTTADAVTGDPYAICVSCRFSTAGSAQYRVDMRSLEITDRAEPAAAVLDDATILVIAEQAIRIDELLGTRCRVEWSLERDTLWTHQVDRLVDLPAFSPEQPESGSWKLASRNVVSVFARGAIGCGSASRIINGRVYRLQAGHARADWEHCGKEMRSAGDCLSRWRTVEQRLRAGVCEALTLPMRELDTARVGVVLGDCMDAARQTLAAMDDMEKPRSRMLHLLQWVAANTTGDTDIYRKLISGLDDPAVMRDARLQELGDKLRSAERAGSMDQPGWWRSFKNEVEQFSREYGCSFTHPGQQYDPGCYTSWIEDDDPVLRVIGALKRQDKRPSLVTLHSAAQEESAAAASQMTKLFEGKQRARFIELLRLSRELLEADSALQELAAAAGAAVRLAMAEMGSRLTERGLLQHADDAYLMTLEELIAAPEEPSDAEIRLAARKIAERKHSLWLEQRLSPPEELGEPLQDKPAAHGTAQSIILRPGSASGAAAVLRSLSQAAEVQRGDILVVPDISPAFTSLLAVAGGLVSENGSECSAAAVLAAEHGVPVIVECEGILSSAASGERIRVNCSGHEAEVLVGKERAQTASCRSDR